MEKNSNSIKDANESDNFFFQLLGFIHLCHDNVKAAAAAVPNSPSKSESSSSFELDIEGQAVRMSWCRRAAHAAALLRRKTDHGAKTIWDTMWKFLFSLHIAKTILILFMNEHKGIHLRTKRILLEPVWNKRHCLWKMSTDFLLMIRT